MKIRRLEIQGFKSFADKTVLTFGEGITGVVGPNGCGKSNIVDAIRWAMGEQSAKHLRGQGMQDIIFAGSESRGPQGLSEVTITFKNDGALVPPEYAKFDEISVTRRLFRDGTSEYAINKVSCRLRDILDLFMGTGIGKQAYSIIEQGRIGLIVTAKPEDRRTFIEEAAGISRYKARRKQAERRIEATEQNLLRVTDITNELKQRIGSLERQAKKAERYKRLRGELRELDLCAAAHRHFELDAMERFAATEAQGVREQIGANEEAIDAEELRIHAALSALSAKEQKLREREAELHEHQQALALARNNVEFLGRERDGQLTRRAEAEAEQAELTTELVTLRADRDSAEQLGRELDSTGGEERALLVERERALAELGASIEAAQRALEDDKQAMVATLTTIARHNNNLHNLDRTEKDLESRSARAETAVKAAAERHHELERELREVRKALDQTRQLKLALEERRHSEESLAEQLRAEYADNEAVLQSSRHELMDKRSRLNSLAEIRKNYEGCKEGVRAIMKKKEEDITFSASLYGLVADVVSSERRYETAIEAVLGDRLQYVIVGGHSDAAAAVDYLRSESHGRSSFIPLDLREDHTPWAPRPAAERARRASLAPAVARQVAPEVTMVPQAPAWTLGVDGAGHVADGPAAAWVPVTAPESVASDRPAGISEPPPAWSIEAAPLASEAPRSSEGSGAAGSVPPGAWTIGEAGGGSPLFAPAVDAAPSQVPSEGPAPWTVLDAKGVDGGETISAGPGPWSVQAAPEPGKTQPIEAASASSLPVPEAAEEGWDDVWPDLASPGVLGKLIELVRAQPGYEHVARVLLGDVVVVEDLATARRLWGENGHRKTIVTLAGEVLDPVGVLTGGTAETVSSGMLAQKREINELTEQVRELEVKVRTAEERHAALKYRLAELDLAIKELSRSGHQEDLSIVKLERDLKRLEEGVARHEQERATYEEELGMIADQRAAIAAELEQTKVSIRELEEKRDAAEVSVAAKSMEVNSLREAYRTLAEQVTELKVTVAANAERREGSLRNLTRIVARIADVETRLARLADVQKECEIESERLLDKIEQSKVEAVALAEKIDREKAELTVESEGLEAEAKQLRDEESDFRSRRKVIDTLKEQLGAAQIKMRECQLGRESLLQQVDERYRINLADVLQDYHLVPPQTDDDRAEMEKLRNQIDHIGPINLTAIEEFNQVNERYTFLSAQKEDLEQAIAALRAAIRRINSTSKERYMEAFRLVNEKFQLVFPRLFNGGSASLVMLDESDPLESGIEMLAQPPGKKLQSVNLLSGGEKALTAVSLIFSIFLIKPTPFCLLDEVDAPLDEANVGRYNDMVKDMSKVSQFILITHNKRTMELPDRLYGVTMEEPGISKIVPVDVKGERSKSSQSLRAV